MYRGFELYINAFTLIQEISLQVGGGKFLSVHNDGGFDILPVDQIKSMEMSHVYIGQLTLVYTLFVMSVISCE